MPVGMVFGIKRHAAGSACTSMPDGCVWEPAVFVVSRVTTRDFPLERMVV